MSNLTTYTGLHINPVTPNPDCIDIRDIAHSLSLQCRGNGQVTQFFSVAQHCINCAKEAEARGYSDRLVLACLIHDAAESYMSDVPRPLKRLLPDYIAMEDKFLTLIYTKFLGSDLTDEEKVLVKKIDDDNLYFDLTFLLKEHLSSSAPEMLSTLNYDVRPFEDVEKEYLEIYGSLAHLVIK